MCAHHSNILILFSSNSIPQSDVEKKREATEGIYVFPSLKGIRYDGKSDESAKPEIFIII